MGFGGMSDANTLGRALLDPQNDVRDHDDGATSASANLGIFTALTLLINYDGAPSNPLALFRQLFDPLTPFSGGTGSFGGAVAGAPVGTHAQDALVLSPTANPTSFTLPQATRQRAVLRALDALARNIASTAAHEIGHSLGLVPSGAPPKGLFAGVRADWMASYAPDAHIDTVGLNVMQTGGSVNWLEAATGDLPRFEPLSWAYLRRQLVVGPP
jgi:hypothetical protein